MGTVANPFQSIIDGLITGHGLAHQIKQQAMQEEAHQRAMARDDQESQMRDFEGKMKAAKYGRPVIGGMIENDELQAPAGPLPAVTPGGPVQGTRLVRKAIPSRTVTVGNQQFEIKTDDEQQRAALDQQVEGKTRLETAMEEAKQTARQNVLKMRGRPVPADIATALRMEPGTLVLPEEIPTLAQHAQSIVKGGYMDVGPEHTLLNLFPGNTPGGAPAADGAQPGGPQVVARGAAPKLTGEFATVYLPKYAASLNKKPEDLTIDELEKGLGKFKEANSDPAVREATLAGKAAAQASKELADTMRRIQLGQMPTKEDAAAISEQIRNHELAPSQLSEIRGRAAGSLGLLVEREMRKTDPHFSWQQADSDYAFSKTPGFQNTVRYMDSVSESIPLVIDRATKLGNGNLRGLNALMNMGKAQFNDVDLKKFNTDRLLVADEVAKILQGGGTGGGTSDAKLKQAGEVIKESDSPRAIAAALGEVQQLIGYRRKTLTRGTYMEGAAAPASGEQKVTTQAQYDALAKGATYTGEDGQKYKKP